MTTSVRLAPEPVAEVAEHEAADRPCHEADGERGERGSVPASGPTLGKNSGEHQAEAVPKMKKSYHSMIALLREQGAGPTILVSPLLALMRDQVRAAARLGLRAASIDSTNTEQWADITAEVLAGDIDVLLVSPERLANHGFVARVLEPLLDSIGMLVVDEAHCISDWGHDFRPDYRRISQLVPRLREDVAVLATTATANDAVARDVVLQLGERVELLRGPLARKSLRLQAIHLASEHERMAWLAEQLPRIEGSGIIYVLTKAHAKRIAEFLRAQGIDADHYTGAARPARRGPAQLELERRLVTR